MKDHSYAEVISRKTHEAMKDLVKRMNYINK